MAVVDKRLTLFWNSQTIFSHVGGVVWGIKLKKGREEREGEKGEREEREGGKGGKGEREEREGGKGGKGKERKGRKGERERGRNDVNIATNFHSPQANKPSIKKLPPNQLLCVCTFISTLQMAASFDPGLTSTTVCEELTSSTFSGPAGGLPWRQQNIT